MKPTIQSPKERFLQDGSAVHAHHNVVDSSATVASLDFAMLQLVERYSRDNGPTAVLNFHRLQGAKDFISIWLTLGDQPKPGEDRPRSDQLIDPDAPPTPKKKES